MWNLLGKRAVVTGASRGIGQAAAIALAQSGADVASIHLADAANASVTERAIRQTGRRAIMVEGDVSDAQQVDDFAQQVQQEWGGIDIWVNNAARILVRPFLEMTDEEWQTLLGSNLNGYYHGCRAALRIMLPAGCGNIVNISSVTDIQPIANMAAYITAKGAVVALTKSLAVEFASRGIVINAVAPGATETQLTTAIYTPAVRKAYNERIAVGRVGQPDDLVGAILFLASSAARYVCGHELVVDGGLHLNGSVGFAADPPSKVQ
jgi:NAD(P)-dependent dehydrogenase (short-subunit alcohol dehydrogenase family)